MKTFQQFTESENFDEVGYFQRLTKGIFPSVRKTKEDSENIFLTFAAKPPRGWYKKLIMAINKCPMSKITMQDDHYQEVDIEVEGHKVTIKKYSYGVGAVIFK